MKIEKLETTVGRYVDRDNKRTTVTDLNIAILQQLLEEANEKINEVIEYINRKEKGGTPSKKDLGSRILEIINRWGEYTSESGIYWEPCGGKDPEKEIVKEILNLIAEENEKVSKKV